MFIASIAAKLSIAAFPSLDWKNWRSNMVLPFLAEIGVVHGIASGVPSPASGLIAPFLPRAAEIRLVWIAQGWENLLKRGYGSGGSVHRPVGRVSRRGRTRQPRRADAPPGAGDWRARHRQGADRRAAPPPVAAL